ncbi:cbb3-type cytochrome oxidase assembly protein CcoS [Chitinimonas koreensis]|nr:cbb3-type cytochrome oxidase assembly protein CcoS [Chitinimonas koreensis]
MESLYLLIPLSVLIALGGGLLFWWATRAGQFDDLEGRRTASCRMTTAPVRTAAIRSIRTPTAAGRKAGRRLERTGPAGSAEAWA